MQDKVDGAKGGLLSGMQVQTLKDKADPQWKTQSASMSNVMLRYVTFRKPAFDMQ